MKGFEALENHKLVLKTLGHNHCEEWENLKDIEKELKAYDLIVKKNVNIHRLLTYSFEDYNLSVVKEWELTYAEYKFLREVLKDEA